jgi:hypothetical protein
VVPAHFFCAHYFCFRSETSSRLKVRGHSTVINYKSFPSDPETQGFPRPTCSKLTLGAPNRPVNFHQVNSVFAVLLIKLIEFQQFLGERWLLFCRTSKSTEITQCNKNLWNFNNRLVKVKWWDQKC